MTCLVCGSDFYSPRAKACDGCRRMVARARQHICVAPHHEGPRILPLSAFIASGNPRRYQSWCRVCAGMPVSRSSMAATPETRQQRVDDRDALRRHRIAVGLLAGRIVA